MIVKKKQHDHTSEKSIPKNLHCLIIAPIDPALRTAATSLGATRKIMGVARMFRENGWKVTVVNSSHSQVGWRGSRIEFIAMADLKKIPVLTPRIFPRRNIGKIFQLFETPFIAHRLRKSKIDLIWIYNGYIFESILASRLLSKTGPALVVELEDWPFERRRMVRSIKNALDWIGLKWAIRRAKLVTCVNNNLLDLLDIRDRGIIFPGLVEKNVISSVPPFKKENITIGFFGGLDKEKGAHLILGAIDRLPAGFKFIVTGEGSLTQDFRKAGDDWPDRLEYHGLVGYGLIAALQQRCDAFINPHRPIDGAKGGIFPFKIFEYLSWSRPVVSTTLPKIEPDITKAILIMEPSIEGLLDAIEKLRAFWDINGPDIQALGNRIRSDFSRSGFYARLRQRLRDQAPRYPMHTQAQERL